ncbi:DUF2207 domain-containing protein [Marinilactibacillus kalidii]|uniref:DUF2207 domain-containing protein n=1 Tax=Marinilactibacillus kalidii TaxID=2820274 RepID=UPI001ABE1961|nr:DUF2207 domain-containing protein [Marinilactibacillus kalidii]
MKKLVGYLLYLMGFGIVVGGQTVQAAENRMPLMEVEVQLQEDGSGVITEHRTMDMEDGTELYIEMNNLDGSEVKDFYVDGYTFDPNWDTDDSREAKAGKYGIIGEDEALELVWGIGEYGTNEYELTYTITDLVRQLEDGQALNWDFNTYGDIAPEAISVTIDGPFEFTQENARIWGFGYDGLVELDDGQLVSTASTGLNANESFVILMQFPESPFTASRTVDQTLEEQLDRSQEGATYNNDSGEVNVPAIIAIIGIILAIPITVGSLLIGIESRKKKAGKIVTGYARKSRNKHQIYTDIPYKDGDMLDIAYFLNEVQYGKFEDYFFAYLLKWSKEEKIAIHHKEKLGWKKKEMTIIELVGYKKSTTTTSDVFGATGNNVNKNEHLIRNMSPLEAKVWSILEQASDFSGIISEEEIKTWSRQHVRQLTKLPSEIKELSEEILIEKGYLQRDSIQFMWGTSSFIKTTREGDQLFDRITQFGNHLDELEKDDSLAYRQNLPWIDFIIWATIYGKGSDVVEKLEKFYPEQYQEWSMHYPVFYGGYYGIYGFSQSMTSGMESGGYNSSAGLGGGTAIGGGGGAMGGGGGGAR